MERQFGVVKLDPHRRLADIGPVEERQLHVEHGGDGYLVRLVALFVRVRPGVGDVGAVQEDRSIEPMGSQLLRATDPITQDLLDADAAEGLDRGGTLGKSASIG